MRFSIIADDKIPFLKGIFEPYADVVYLPGNQITKNTLTNADAIIIRSVTQCNASLLNGTPVKFIATATIGDDHIDKVYCEANGIFWVSSNGCNASAVEQYFTSALLILAEKKEISLKHKTIGIIGVGNIGSKVAKVANILGMNVLLNDPPRARKEGHRDFTELDRILKDADIITLHVPLTLEGEDKTFHLADDNFFKKLKKHIIFINTSRGPVVESGALKNAIKKGKILASAIDVWENEPDIDKELLENVDIATPHIAGYSIEGKANGTAMSVKAISKFFNLSLDDWFPAHIEKPGEKIITIDCENKTDREIIFTAVNKTYDILRDDRKFRDEPDKFELLRSNYKFRWEYGAYKLRVLNCQEVSLRKLKTMGFDVNK